MVALIPLVVVGAILLIVLGKIRLPKSQAEVNRDEEVDKKGFAGVAIDDVSGEGASAALKTDLNEKGLAGVALDGLVGDGAYKKLTDEIDEIETGRQAAVDGFVNYLQAAERGRVATAEAIGRGAQEFVASLHQTAQDAHAGAVGFFESLGIIQVPARGEA